MYRSKCTYLPPAFKITAIGELYRKSNRKYFLVVHVLRILKMCANENFAKFCSIKYKI